MRFEGKRVVITGAASGIGRSTAHLFSEEGAKIYALDVNEEGLTETAEGHKNITTANCNISVRQNCQKAINDAVTEFGGVDILLNIAGIFRAHHIADVDEETWDDIMSVNAAGTFWMSQACMPHLIESKGNIVNIASIAGIIGQGYTVPYCASKGAIVLLTKGLAMEFIKTDVRVNAVAPGGVETPIADSFELPAGADTDLIDRYIGMRGMDKPENIAEAVAFLASEKASSITGVILSVDHGLVAG